MPVTIPNRMPLGSSWTHKDIVSEILVLTGNTDGETVQVSNIRSHVNVALQHIVEVLSVANAPWYGERWNGTFEGALISNMLTLDLGAQGAQIDRIQRLSLSFNPMTPTPNTIPWTGNCLRKDIAVVTSLAKQQNTQYDQSVLWSQFGNMIYFAVGSDIESFITLSTGSYTVMSALIDLWLYRRPMLDIVTNDTVYATQMIDIPERYIPELLAFAEKLTLKQTGKIMPQEYLSEVERLTGEVTKKLQTELALEDKDMQKEKISEPSSAPGAEA